MELITGVLEHSMSFLRDDHDRSRGHEGVRRIRRVPPINGKMGTTLAGRRRGLSMQAPTVINNPLLDATDLAFKRPRRVVFVDALPLNPSGKVLKRELVATYAEVR
jgi:hypothetical protein